MTREEDRVALTDDGGDDMPLSREARAGEFGRLGVRLAGMALRAGARSLVGDGKEAWSRTHVEAAEELFQTLGRMRGLAAKLGQVLAQRPGTLPDQYVEKMFALSNQVPPMSYSLLKTQLIHELGKSPTELFTEIEHQPMAAASFGQVHRATLPDGTRVAVKVQYPAIDRALRADLDNVRMFVGPLGQVGGLSNITEVFDEIAERVSEEIDYRIEAQNGTTFARIFDGDESIRIPAVHPAYSGRKVLTADLLEGIDVRRFLESQPSQELRQQFGRAFLRVGWTSIFKHRILHADPNPGNYLFEEGGRLGVVDFGCVKRFQPGFVERLSQLILASMHDDEKALDESLVASGLMQAQAGKDLHALLRRAARLWAAPFLSSHFDFGDRTYLDNLVNLQELAQSVQAGHGSVVLPRDWVFYGRYLVGQAYMLYKLGTSGDFAGAILPYLVASST